jgi:hypothetical protein
MVIWGEEKLLLHERFILLRTKLTAVSALLKIPSMKNLTIFKEILQKRFIEINKRNELPTQKEYFCIVLSLLVAWNNLLTVRYSKKGEGEHLNCEEQNRRL